MNKKINVKTIGFIGLGVMGMPMFKNLCSNKNLNVNGYDINSLKLNEIKKLKLSVSSNIENIFEISDLVITCLPSGKDVEEVYFKNKMINLVKKNQIIIDMSTSQPALMTKIENKIRNKGAYFVDAPIARTRQAAIDGSLAIMVGCSKNIFKIIKPILSLIGNDILHCGEVGSGQFTKILNNMILFQNVLALCEASKIAENYNLNCEKLFQNISKCSGNSFALQNHGMKSIVNDHYPNPAFSVKYAQKDLSYALELAKNKKINAPGCLNINELFKKAIEDGFGDLYFPVIKKVI